MFDETESEQIRPNVTLGVGGRQLQVGSVVPLGIDGVTLQAKPNVKPGKGGRQLQVWPCVNHGAGGSKLHDGERIKSGCDLPDFKKIKYMATAIHCDNCNKYGIVYQRRGFEVPGWSRYWHNIIMDIIVHKEEEGKCDCHMLFQKYDIYRGIIHLSAWGVSKGLKPQDMFFVHIITGKMNIRSEGWFTWFQPPIGNIWTRLSSSKRCRALRSVEFRGVNIQVSDAEIGRLDGLAEKMNDLIVLKRHQKPTAPNMPLPYSNIGRVKAVPSNGKKVNNAQKASRKKSLGRDSQGPNNKDYHYLHIGDHSITGNGTLDLNTKLNKEASTQNFLSWIDGRFGYDIAHILIDETDERIGVEAGISGNDAPFYQAHAVYQGWFDVWCPNSVEQANISTRYGLQKSVLNDALMSSFMIDTTNYNTKSIAGAVAANIGVSFQIGQNIAGYVTLAKRRYNNTALYAKGWALALLRAVTSMKDRTVNPYVPNWHPAGGTYRERSWADAQVASNLAEDISAGAFVVLSRDHSAAIINCFKHLARGGAAMVQQADINNPTMNKINWFSIDISVYYSGAAPNLPLGDFAAEEMRTAICELAATRGELQDLVQGYVKVIPLLCTHLSEYEADVHRMYCCTLEVFRTFHWPRPTDYNPLWRWLSVVEAESTGLISENEIGVLRSKQMKDLLYYGIVGGALMSSGMSWAFHTQNINGRFLNKAANPALAGPGQILAFSEQIFRANARTNVPTIFKIMCAELMHITSVAINHDAFIQDGWCANFTGVGVVTQNSHWNGEWGFRIPYLIHPLCTAWALHGWPSLYGVFRDNVTVDLQSDVILNGTQAGWYASRGCQEYRRITTQGKTSQPWVYIAYGSTVINGLCQQFKLTTRPAVQVQKWMRAFDANSPQPVVETADNYVGRDWDGSLFMFTPGSVRTYDWFNDCTLSPVVPARSWRANVWTFIRSGNLKILTIAGIIAPEMSHIVGEAVGAFDALAIYGERDDPPGVPRTQQMVEIGGSNPTGISGRDESNQEN